jgi:hypothetical protein
MKIKKVMLAIACASVSLMAFKAKDLLKPVNFEETVISENYLGWWGRTVADINKDGLMDVMVLKRSRTYGPVNPGWLGWFQVKDGGKTWEKHVIENNDLLGAGDLAVADLDNDGDIDFLSFEGDETSKDTTARMYWWENKGAPKLDKWERHFISNNPEFVKDVEIADFDGNGLKDIATITYWHHALEVRNFYIFHKFSILPVSYLLSYRKMKKIYILSHLITLSFILSVQPKPTDIFREYTWATPKPSANGQELFLRVCGDGFYDDAVQKGEHLFPKGYVNDGWFTLPQDIDLKDAVRAEILVERMLCHDGSTGLAVKFNAGEWHAFPDADSIPKPQSEYLYHYYPIISVPLTELKTGANANQFRFTIDKTQRWGMPQNMVYGMVVRVYYKASKPHAEADILTLKSGDVMGEKVDLNIKSKSPFSKVEYIGLMENINYEGDGRYHQWH